MKGTIRRCAIGLSAVAMMGLVGSAVPGGVAGATVSTYTWTGADELGSAHNPVWSDALNWKGGVAPSAPGPVNLVFPSPTCAGTNSHCGLSQNDLSGLTVASLTIDAALTRYQPGAYDIFGNGITLDTLKDNGPPYFFPTPTLSLPVTLGGSETWTFDGGFLNIQRTVTGTGTLTVSLTNQAQPSFFSAVSVAALDVVGKDPNDIGTFASDNGSLDLQSGSSINAPVSVKRAEFFDTGSSTIGALTTNNSFTWVGLGTPTSGVLNVNGGATLDKGSVAYYYNMAPGTAGTNYGELTASGAVNLNSAQIFVTADCGETLGTTYTLVSATGGLTGVFREDLQQGNKTISNGTIIQAESDSDGSCTGSNAPPYLQFAYNDAAGTVTATVVASAAHRA